MKPTPLTAFHRRLVIAMYKASLGMERTGTVPPKKREEIASKIDLEASYVSKALSWKKTAENAADPVFRIIAKTYLHYDWPMFESTFPDPLKEEGIGIGYFELLKPQRLVIEEEITRILDDLAKQDKEKQPIPRSILFHQIDNWFRGKKSKFKNKEVMVSMIPNYKMRNNDGMWKEVDFLLKIQGLGSMDVGIFLWEDGEDFLPILKSNLRSFFDDRIINNYIVLTSLETENEWLSKKHVLCFSFAKFSYIIEQYYFNSSSLSAGSSPFRFHGGDQISQSIFNALLKPLTMEKETRAFVRELFKLREPISIWMILSIFQALGLDWSHFKAEYLHELNVHQPQSDMIQMLQDF